MYPIKNTNQNYKNKTLRYKDNNKNNQNNKDKNKGNNNKRNKENNNCDDNNKKYNNIINKIKKENIYDKYYLNAYLKHKIYNIVLKLNYLASKVKIVDSTNKYNIGYEGIIYNETKNCFYLIPKDLDLKSFNNLNLVEFNQAIKHLPIKCFDKKTNLIEMNFESLIKQDYLFNSLKTLEKQFNINIKLKYIQFYIPVKKSFERIKLKDQKLNEFVKLKFKVINKK